MAEHYSFFDAVLEDDGVTYDREYNAQQFTNYFGSLITTGVMKGEKNELKVTANGSNMITNLDTGVAFLQGRYYENDSPLDLIHDTETLGRNRIDRIVVRMDLSTEARYVKTFIKKGTPTSNPVAPALTQTDNLYEISLAQVKVVGGQTFIYTKDVIDERGTNIICPWSGSNILPNVSGIEDLITMDGPYNLTIQGTATGTILSGKFLNGVVWLSIRFNQDLVNPIPVGGVIAILPPGFAPKNGIQIPLVITHATIPPQAIDAALILTPEGKIVLPYNSGSNPPTGPVYTSQADIIFLADPTSEVRGY